MDLEAAMTTKPADDKPTFCWACKSELKKRRYTIDGTTFTVTEACPKHPTAPYIHDGKRY